MKPRHLPLLLLPAASFAATASMPAQAAIGLPPLSLADGAKQALPEVFRKDGPWAHRHPSLFASTPTAPGLLMPKRDVDPKMIVPPDPAIDAKILVVPPSREVDAK